MSTEGLNRTEIRALDDGRIIRGTKMHQARVIAISEEIGNELETVLWQHIELRVDELARLPGGLSKIAVLLGAIQPLVTFIRIFGQHGGSFAIGAGLSAILTQSVGPREGFETLVSVTRPRGIYASLACAAEGE